MRRRSHGRPRTDLRARQARELAAALTKMRKRRGVTVAPSPCPPALGSAGHGQPVRQQRSAATSEATILAEYPRLVRPATRPLRRHAPVASARRATTAHGDAAPATPRARRSTLAARVISWHRETTGRRRGLCRHENARRGPDSHPRPRHRGQGPEQRPDVGRRGSSCSYGFQWTRSCLSIGSTGCFGRMPRQGRRYRPQSEVCATSPWMRAASSGPPLRPETGGAGRVRGSVH
jgi:hypothetical protein